MKFASTQHRFRLILLAGVAGPPVASSAQVASPPPQVAASAALEAASSSDIIVTAQLRNEKLEDVPASVTAVSGDQLERSSVSRFQDLGNIAPGVMISRTGIVTQPAIRGITSIAAGTGAENNVAVYIDGFYQTDQYSINQDFANLKDIQVLKGPQGTLYGRNATGGAILVNTLDPGNDVEGRLLASYGTLNDIRVQASAALPIVTDKIALGINAYYRKNDGYIRDLNNFASPALRNNLNPNARLPEGANTTPYTNRAVRVKLKVTPADGIALTLGYNHFYVADPSGNGYQITGFPSTLVTGVINGTNASAAGFTQAYQQRDRTSLNFPPQAVATGDEVTLLGVFETGDFGTLTTHTSYLKKRDRQMFDFDATPSDVLTVTNIGKRRTFIQAVDYAYQGIDRLDLLVGGMYFTDNMINPHTTSTGLAFGASGTGGNDIFGQLKTNYAYATYIDGTYRIGDRLFVTAGVRYSKEEKFVERTSGGLTGPKVSQRGPGQPSTKSWDGVTPRLVVRYNLDTGTNVYASFSKGFKSGTFSSGGAPLNPVKPEKITAYEAGIKTKRGRLRADAAIFYYDYTDLQVSQVLLVNSVVSTLLQNAADSEIYGGEANVVADVADGLSVRAGLSYLHARYTSFPDATATDVNVATNTNITSTFNNPQDWTGLQMIRSPKFSGNVGADYVTEAFGGSLLVNGLVFFTTKYASKDDSLLRYVAIVPGTTPLQTVTVNDTGQRRYLQKAYALANISATWTDDSGRYSIGAYVENVTNKRYKVYYASNTQAGDYAVYNAPRLIGVKLGLRY